MAVLTVNLSFVFGIVPKCVLYENSSDCFWEQMLYLLFLSLLEVVPVEVASVILQSVNGTQTLLQISGGESLNPFLLNPTLCANVVLKVKYLYSNI